MASATSGVSRQQARSAALVGMLLGVLLIGIGIVVAVTVVRGASWAMSQTGPARGVLRFSDPTYLAADAAGNVYVADNANRRVVKLSSAGKLLATWRSFGGPAETDSGPGPIAIDAHDDVYVASAGKIQEFSSSGRRLALWPLGFDPQGLAIDTQGRVYLTDASTNRILVFSPAGVPLAIWKTKGSGPQGIAIGKQGKIYVADTASNRIEVLSSKGKLLALWGKRGQRLGQYDQPDDVATDSSGSVYVADSGNHRLQMLSSDGKVLGWWGSWGTGRGQFTGVTRLFDVVDRHHAVVYVTDSAGGDVHKFTWDGTALAKWD